MPEKSPEIPREEEQQQLSPEEKGDLELDKGVDSTAEKIKALKKMKEMVEERERKKEEKELLLERRLSPGEKRKINRIIEKVFERKPDITKLETKIEPLGEKIVEPILDKLESFKDSDFKEKHYGSFLLIFILGERVKEKDAERLADLLLRGPIVLDGERSKKEHLVQMLGRVGNEKIIDKLAEYSKKVIIAPYFEKEHIDSVRKRRISDQISVQSALSEILKRRTLEEKDEEKIKEIKTKTERALDIIEKNIESLGE